MTTVNPIQDVLEKKDSLSTYLYDDEHFEKGSIISYIFRYSGKKYRLKLEFLGLLPFGHPATKEFGNCIVKVYSDDINTDNIDDNIIVCKTVRKAAEFVCSGIEGVKEDKVSYSPVRSEKSSFWKEHLSLKTI